MTQTKLRSATTLDFPLIHKIASRTANLEFIEDSPDAVLQAFIDDTDAALVIWERDDVPAGFALFNELDHPNSQVELRRLALDQTDKGYGQQFLKDLVCFGFESLNKDRV